MTYEPSWVEPDWDGIHQRCDGPHYQDDQSFRHGLEIGRRQGLDVFLELLRWIDNDGRARRNGVRNRAIVLLFLFSKDYAEFNQTDLLLRFRLYDRQLLNRELRDFCRVFGAVDRRCFTEAGRRALERARAIAGDKEGNDRPGSAGTQASGQGHHAAQ